VILVVPTTLRLGISIALPEATYAAIEEEGRLTAVSAQHIQQTATDYNALLVGPGLGDADDFITALFPADGDAPALPTVIDADGLNGLARLDNWWERRRWRG
jgi:NAD(P)H-hydrate repair Nnr-like enzyme with NAD(P)H-hydrate dehydratase domain